VYGRLDILVSNAAVNPTAGPLLEVPLEAVDKILDINVKAALGLVQEAAPHMQRGGAVVLVSSVTAYK
jgi:dehydrogenase/reductase SDR family protein 4